MKVRNDFGNTSVVMSIRPLRKDMPPDPSVLPQIQAFLSVVERAHDAGLQHRLDQLLDIFADEVNNYIDDHLLAIDELAFEMEGFMDDMNKKRKK